VGTNPEELPRQHAGGFAMQLSAFIGEEGFTTESIETKCEINLVDGVISSHNSESKNRRHFRVNFKN
jgi:osmotically inducible protein OsmC